MKDNEWWMLSLSGSTHPACSNYWWSISYFWIDTQAHNRQFLIVFFFRAPRECSTSMALQVCLLSYCFRYSSVWQFQVVLTYSIISIIWWFFFLHLSVFESFYSFLKFRSFPPERLQYVLCCRVSWIFWYNLHWSFWIEIH